MCDLVTLSVSLFPHQISVTLYGCTVNSSSTRCTSWTSLRSAESEAIEGHVGASLEQSGTQTPNQCWGHGVPLVLYLLESALYKESLNPGDAIGLRL